MTYKGYGAAVAADDEPGVVSGRVAGLRDVITFSATDVHGLERAFRESVDDYLLFCASLGQRPEQPSASILDTNPR